MTTLKLNTNILMLGDFITLKKGIMLVNFEQNTIKGKKGSCRGYLPWLASQQQPSIPTPSKLF